MAQVTLTDRGLVELAGPDCETLLQDVISCDVVGLPPGHVRPGALLTAQGKILFEFLLSRKKGSGFLVEIPQDQIAAFIQRMTLYRLRAKVTFEPVENVTVAACWECSSEGNDLADERFRDGHDVFRRYGAPVGNGEFEDYSRLRIRAGVPEAGHDYDLSDAFPHDVLMDLNGGVSLKKGCYVGQEVVSRMQHRGTARRRIVQVLAEHPLPKNRNAVEASGRTIGQLGTTVGVESLALVRTDRVAKALDDGLPITIEGQSVQLTLPVWTELRFPREMPPERDANP